MPPLFLAVLDGNNQYLNTMNDDNDPIIPEDEEEIDPLKAPILDPEDLDVGLADPADDTLSLDLLVDEELADEEEDEEEVEYEGDE